MAGGKKKNTATGGDLVFACLVGLGGLAAALVYWPVSLGLLLGLLLRRWPLTAIGPVAALAGLRWYAQDGNPLTPEGFVAYGLERFWAMTHFAQAVAEGAIRLRSDQDALLAHSSALFESHNAGATRNVPVFALAVLLGTLWALLWGRGSRGSSAAPAADSPPSTPQDATPRKGASSWTLDGGLPEGLGDGPVTRFRALFPGWSTRYRVAQWGIFGRVGPPRYRVLHGKGGVGALFTRFRAACLHGNGDLHGGGSELWVDSYLVELLLPGRLRRYTVAACKTVYRVAMRNRVRAPGTVYVAPTVYPQPLPCRQPVTRCYTVSHDGTYGHMAHGADQGQHAGDAPRDRRPRGADHPGGAVPDGGGLPEQAHPGGPQAGDGSNRGGGGARGHHSPGSPGIPPADSVLQGSADGAESPGSPVDVPDPGCLGPTGALGQVETWMSPPKMGKTVVQATINGAVLSGGEALGWPCGQSGIVWLIEESAETFAPKRRITLRKARSATGSPAVDPDPYSEATGATLPRSVDVGLSTGYDPESLLTVVYGPGKPTGLPQLCVYLAEAVQWCRLAECATGVPHRLIVVDSLFFWVPEAETDVQVAGAVMALFKAVASLGYTVRVTTHADPESGRQKGPQQLWRQTDRRVALVTDPRKAGPEQTDRRRLIFTGRYDTPAGRPPDVVYRLSAPGAPAVLVAGGQPARDAAAARLSRMDSGGPRGAPAFAPEAPSATPALPLPPPPPPETAEQRFLAALPPEGLALVAVKVDGWSKSRTYQVAQDLRRRGVLVESVGKRGALTLRRRLPSDPPAAPHVPG